MSMWYNGTKRRYLVALDGILLHTYVASIQKKIPLKINRIFQYSDHEIVFHGFNREKVVLYASMHAQTNRLQLLRESNEKSHQTSNFLSLLKKYCESGTLVSLEQNGFDRIVKMKITSKNELFETISTTIAIELMGKYANMVLIDENNLIIDSLYRIAPYQNSKRIIIPSAPYVEVDSLQKKSPLTYTNEATDQLLEHFEGFSPILANEMEYRIKNKECFHDVLTSILESDTLYVANEKPSVFHAIPLTHTNYTFSEFGLHEGLTHVYYTLDSKKRIKDITNDVAKTIKRELKKALSKKEKLENALIDSEDADEYRIKGDYCYTYATLIHKGMSKVTLPTFDQQDTITFDLNPKLSAIQNGQLYYKKYQKLISSVPHIENQIKLAQDKIDYFHQLDDQLSYISVEDAIEIKEELAGLGYFKQQKKKKKNTKKSKPNVLIIKYDEDTLFYVGKNNIQNDAVTFTLASKKDTWFHTRHHHGAHIVVSSSKPLQENHIRDAALLAAYYSKARYSSSVEVMYTKVANIKKIPQAPKGMVSVSTYQSIFIDPDETTTKNIISRK